MSRFDDFDKDFDKSFKRTQKFIGLVFVVQALFALLVLAGIGYVAYLLLKHFGVL